MLTNSELERSRCNHGCPPSNAASRHSAQTVTPDADPAIGDARFSHRDGISPVGDWAPYALGCADVPSFAVTIWIA